MKNLLIILSIVVLSSCQKNYTCLCDVKVIKGNDTTESKRVSNLKTTKKQMNKICKNDSWITYSNGQPETVEMTNCEIH